MMQVEEASRLVSYLKTLCNFMTTEEDKNIKAKAAQAYVKLCNDFDSLPDGMRAKAIEMAKPVLSEPKRIRIKDGREFMLVPDRWKRNYDIPSIEIGIAASMKASDIEKVFMVSSVFDGNATRP